MRVCLLAFALAACGDTTDPCADVPGRCLAVRVETASSHDIAEIDQLELDVLYDTFHGTTTTAPPGGGTVALPLATALTIDVASRDDVAVGVVAAGKLAGAVLGTGAASIALGPDEHATLTIALGAPQSCVAGSYYCGGDKIAGNPDTLYECNAGGVPLARGVCAFGCVIDPGDDDTCRGGGGACVEGGFYCGGDKLDGDPQTLYRCASGAGTSPQECPNACVVAPPGMDDFCR